MEKTPLSMRKHIAILGKVNSGKSTLFNALLGQDMSIVSDVKGTTTDPVVKSAEIIPYGPVAIIDTAGLCDDTELGTQRMQKTEDILKRTNLIIYVSDIKLSFACPLILTSLVKRTKKIFFVGCIKDSNSNRINV